MPEQAGLLPERLVAQKSFIFTEKKILTILSYINMDFIRLQVRQWLIVGEVVATTARFVRHERVEPPALTIAAGEGFVAPFLTRNQG